MPGRFGNLLAFFEVSSNMKSLDNCVVSSSTLFANEWVPTEVSVACSLEDWTPLSWLRSCNPS